MNQRIAVRGACLTVLIANAAAIPFAFAQDAAADKTPPEALEELVISGSRIERSGFTAPTPVTVLGVDDIQKRGAGNIADVMNEVPSFRPTETTTTNTFTAGGAGRSSADLRGLGSVRTLTLVNGRRFVPSAVTGQVDLNLIPAVLVQRVEVVTGGASAAWGSDAVAGVVNLILDNKLDGLRSELQYGQSTHDDNKETKAAVAAGVPFADARGHIVVGAEYDDNKGIGDPYSRDWGRLEWGAATNGTPGVNGQPATILGTQFHFATQSPGGLITSGPLRGTTFRPGGVPAQFAYGGAVYGDNMFGGEGERANLVDGQALKNPVKRYNALSHIEYRITDSINSFGELAYARSEATSVNGNAVRDPGSGNRALVIRRENPFLPASIRAQMVALNLQTITMGRTNREFGPSHADSSTDMKRVLAGLEGEVGGGWRWDGYYQYGTSGYQNDQINFRLASNWLLAVDAIADPVTGAPICRTVATNPTCRPFNPFGQGSASPESIAYVMGNGWYDLKTVQQVAAANIKGEPFSTWAGPVSLATGVEYRKERADADSDSISQADGFNVGNLKPIHGQYDVKEGYVETLLPLIVDKPWARSLEFNAAARYTDYSTSGNVITWKAGISYSPTDELRIRATRSRDIRAPNLNELFSSQQQTRVNVRNPFLAVPASLITSVYTGGNTHLVPEVADSWTAGIVYQPAWLPRLRTSVDFFDIDLADQIGTLTAQNIVDFCFNGSTQFCSSIQRDAANVISRIDVTTLNLTGFKTRGVDLEASYNLPVSAGSLSMRLLGTYVANYIGIVLNSAGAPVATDRVGQLGTGGGGGNAAGGVPRWLLNASLTYATGPLSLNAQLRFISSGIYNVTWIGPDDANYSPALSNSINDNTVPSMTYLNLSAQYDFASKGNDQWQLFCVVNNVMDKDPLPVATGFAMTNTTYYDVVGRSYRAGVRFTF